VPELPEVEWAARQLRRWLSGRRLVAVRVDTAARRLFRPNGPARFARALTGALVEEVDRHGKQLLVTLRAGAGPLGVNAHLGMTGQWVSLPGSGPAPRHARLSLTLDDGRRVHYLDPRMFGRLRLVPEARFDRWPDLAALGPDPMAARIDLERLAARLGATRRAVKVALLDQSLLAGVGNIHASEACWRARLDPRRRGDRLTAAEVSRLARAVRSSLRFGLAGLDALGDRPLVMVEQGGENPFHVYERAGARCRHAGCGGAIRRLVQAGRSTYFCERCQA
jgi:formamidopyrimidine-DNA glycosylase